MRLCQALLLAAGLISLSVPAYGHPAPYRIACIGSASLFGPGAQRTNEDSSPAQLQNMLGDTYQVRSFKADGDYQEALRFLPDLVFLACDHNEGSMADDEAVEHAGRDRRDVVESFLRPPSHPRLVLLVPPSASTADSTKPSRTHSDSLFIVGLQRLAYESGCEIINLRTYFLGLDHLFSTHMSLTSRGARLLASRLAEVVALGSAPPFALFATLRMQGTHTSYFGFDCSDVTFEGRNAKIVLPKRSAPGHPWIWRARFWGHEPQTEIALLERGFHVVYCDVAELFGNDEAIRIWNEFYGMLTEAGLSARAVLEGFSRGGIYVYRWAAANPDRVACVYADAPVLDLKSWPGGKGRGGGNPAEWERFKQDFHLASEDEALAFKGNPLDLARVIAGAGFPMLHVCGEADTTVPIDENTDIFEKHILASGGRITVIRKPGIGHHPHSLPNPQPIVDFILSAVH